MMTHPIPEQPWQAVTSDCFEIQREHYIVLVDLYSDYIEVTNLPDMSTRSVIQQLKPIFAIHGTPAVLITDYGSNYSSQEFRDFTESWEIHHVTTSPHHHRSNGKAKSAVKIIKSIITKAKKEDGDMWKAILEWRNAPTPGLCYHAVKTCTHLKYRKQ
jgi:transposase InsO family protein